MIEAGSYFMLIDSCITQLKADGPSRTCNESKEDGIEWRVLLFARQRPTRPPLAGATYTYFSKYRLLLLLLLMGLCRELGRRTRLPWPWGGSEDRIGTGPPLART